MNFGKVTKLKEKIQKANKSLPISVPIKQKNL
jgi:hypothetical protein